MINVVLNVKYLNVVLYNFTLCFLPYGRDFLTELKKKHEKKDLIGR